MNIAYLILAHNKPEQLKRMIDRLDEPWAHFFIHIDKKSNDLDVFKELFNNRERIHIISIHKIYWFGFNMVKATIDLLKLSVSSKTTFKYHVLLSGHDYPIRPNSYIYRFFDEHNADFTDYNRVADLQEKFREKYLSYYNMDIKYLNPRDRAKIGILVRLYFGLYTRIAKKFPRRAFYNNMTPFFGSQWFAFTHETVKYLLDFIEKNKGYITFMKYTKGPDELFFQSILLNSERKTNVCDHERFTEWIKTKKEGDIFSASFTSLHFMDWNDRGPGHTKPAILETGDFDALRSTRRDLFARKFDDNRSKALLDKIDAELLADEK